MGELCDKSVNECLGMSSSSSAWHLGVDNDIKFLTLCCFDLSGSSGLYDTLKELIEFVILTHVNSNLIKMVNTLPIQSLANRFAVWSAC